jgi:hypothetical protein
MRLKHKWLLASASIFVVGLVAACSGAAAPAVPPAAPAAAPRASGATNSDSAKTAASGQAQTGPGGAGIGSAGAGAPSAAQPASQPSQILSPVETGQSGRMVIRTVSLRMIVDDVDQTLNTIYDLANTANGFVLSSEATDVGTDRTGRASIRVPGERMDDVLKRIRGMATKVIRETGNAQDVTEEYVDQDARLRSLQTTEAQYLKLLESAKTMDEILRVQQPIDQVREQMERIKGRMNYLQHNTDMSTITVELVTPVGARSVTAENVDAWAPQKVLDDALRALTGVGRGVAAVGIWVLVFSPVWGAATIVWLWVRRRDRRAASA